MALLLNINSFKARTSSQYFSNIIIALNFKDCISLNEKEYLYLFLAYVLKDFIEMDCNEIKSNT